MDEICNLACPVSPIHYQHDPVQTTKISVHGAINMVGLANSWLRTPADPSTFAKLPPVIRRCVELP